MQTVHIFNFKCFSVLKSCSQQNYNIQCTLLSRHIQCDDVYTFIQTKIIKCYIIFIDYFLIKIYLKRSVYSFIWYNYYFLLIPMYFILKQYTTVFHNDGFSLEKAIYIIKRMKIITFLQWLNCLQTKQALYILIIAVWWYFIEWIKMTQNELKNTSTNHDMLKFINLQFEDIKVFIQCNTTPTTQYWKLINTLPYVVIPKCHQS